MTLTKAVFLVARALLTLLGLGAILASCLWLVLLVGGKGAAINNGAFLLSVGVGCIVFVAIVGLLIMNPVGKKIFGEMFDFFD